jgi:hypothetical protein
MTGGKVRWRTGVVVVVVVVMVWGVRGGEQQQQRQQRVASQVESREQAGRGRGTRD